MAAAAGPFECSPEHPTVPPPVSRSAYCHPPLSTATLVAAYSVSKKGNRVQPILQVLVVTRSPINLPVDISNDGSQNWGRLTTCWPPGCSLLLIWRTILESVLNVDLETSEWPSNIYS